MWKNIFNIDKILKEAGFNLEIKVAGWRQVQEKALKIRDEGRVQLLRADSDVIASSVRGENDEYQVTIYRQDNNSRSVSTWECTCPWGINAFKDKKNKNFVGRFCAHALATLWEADSKKPQNPVPSE